MPMTTKLDRVVSYHQGLPTIKSYDSLITWSWEIMWQTKYKLYLHYHNAYGYQTWQDANLPWWDPIHNVTWLFDHVILWGYATD